MREIEAEIQAIVDENDVVLFMKGTKDMPACGFSSVVVQILTDFDIDFKDVNVMADQEIREGIKVFSDWPTIPQLYVKGEFIGGCDIVKDMYESGELEEIFE